jgi:hypothetical protein
VSANDPFGKPPEETVNFEYPSDDDNPYRPIGKYEDGKLVSGEGTDRCEAIGKIIAVTPKQGPSGPMAVFTVVVTEGPFAGREFDLYCSFSPKAKFKLDETHDAIGLPRGPYPKSAAIGVYVVCKLQDEEYNDQWSAKLKGLKKHPKGAGYRGTANLPA